VIICDHLEVLGFHIDWVFFITYGNVFCWRITCIDRQMLLYLTEASELIQWVLGSTPCTGSEIPSLFMAEFKYICPPTSQTCGLGPPFFFKTHSISQLQGLFHCICFDFDIIFWNSSADDINKSVIHFLFLFGRWRAWRFSEHYSVMCRNIEYPNYKYRWHLNGSFVGQFTMY